MTIQDRLSAGKYKLTVDDFVRLDGAGVFGTKRTELLDGDIIIMNAEYRPHGRIRGELWYRLRLALEAIGSDLTAMDASVRVSEHDLPLPHIVLTREPEGDGPIPLGSVALIVEVSSSTLHRDLSEKLAIYARAGVPEYWVADVIGRVIHLFWTPVGESYLERLEVTFGVSISSTTIPGLLIETAVS